MSFGITMTGKQEQGQICPWVTQKTILIKLMLKNLSFYAKFFFIAKGVDLHSGRGMGKMAHKAY